MALVAASLIAAASTAQAALTGWALKRAIDYPLPSTMADSCRAFCC